MMTPRGHLKRRRGDTLVSSRLIVSDENNRVIKQSSQLCLKPSSFQLLLTTPKSSSLTDST